MALLIFLPVYVCVEGNETSQCKALTNLEYYLKFRLIIFEVNFTIIFEAFDKTFDEGLSIGFEVELIFEII